MESDATPVDAEADTPEENAMRHDEFDGAVVLADWLTRAVRTDEVMRELAKLTAEIHELRTILTTKTPPSQRQRAARHA